MTFHFLFFCTYISHYLIKYFYYLTVCRYYLGVAGEESLFYSLYFSVHIFQILMCGLFFFF